MIFIDSNIPMYLIGASHPHKLDAQRLLEQAVIDQERLVTDAEVFQEILHRYTAIRRAAYIQLAFDTLSGIADEVFSVEMDDVMRAKATILETASVSARDALHVAIMKRHGVEQIMSFDRGFDAIGGLLRLGSD
ncbi:MAG: type II toxin-antitoxin system VapC family toxin [Chloroflexi bacterium]|nr:type II toxin-antitoxin system VapC family toxin [Chloroflexota bacterium]MDA1004254.1 type II toxin-antitoxin system VapC family toxin [Chloroflexota bacterium]